MTATRSPVTAPAPARPAGAVVWISRTEAIVALAGTAGGVSTRRIWHGADPELAYLARVVRTIGDRERIVILGPSGERLALEREYVSVFHAPERLVDVEPASRMDEAAVVARLRELMA